ncbi:hypothetical protein ACA910_012970 [Epithemia clementina (nom. ined.)]
MDCAASTGTPTESSRTKKTVLVVKKRRRTPTIIKSSFDKKVKYSARLDNRERRRDQAQAASAPVISKTTKTKVEHQNDNHETKGDDDQFLKELDDNEEMDDYLLCDTFQLIQSLQSATHPHQTCLPIPLSPSGRDILAVLECQLYGAGLIEAAVSSDLSYLLNNNHLLKLSSPKSRIAFASKSDFDIPSPSVILTRTDYCRGVQDAQGRHVTTADTSSPLPSIQQQQYAVAWFLKNLEHWPGERIAVSDIEKVWNHTQQAENAAGNCTAKETSRNLEDILRHLVKIKVLLPCHSEESYQLWLPSWPLVLQAWGTSCTSLIAQLKRSQYKERSLSALGKNRSSPIPMALIVDFLTSMGKTVVVEKPAGQFLKLIDH